jgi:hypothetical protein
MFFAMIGFGQGIEQIWKEEQNPSNPKVYSPSEKSIFMDSIHSIFSPINFEEIYPTSIVITFPDSTIKDEILLQLLGKKLAKSAIPFKIQKEFNYIETDWWAKPFFDKDQYQKFTAFVDKNVITITGEYTSTDFDVSLITGRYKSKEDRTSKGLIQAKGLRNSPKRTAFYNVIYLFKEYIKYMSFE